MIIGTRGSVLALAQANIVADILSKKGIQTTYKIIKTTGDKFTDRPLHEVTGVGAFVRELDDHMIAGSIDIAVHSMKDLPTVRPENLVTSAVLKRDSPYDVILSKDGIRLDDLSAGAIIGTTSMRRKAQLLRYRSDLKTKDLRGNIHTRMKKLEEGQYDAIFLAEAGLERIKLQLKVERLNIENFCPAANQGTIAVVTHINNTKAQECTSLIDDKQTRIETEVERIVIKEIEGGCTAPIGAYAYFINDNEIRILAEVLSLDGLKQVRIDEIIPFENYRIHCSKLAKQLVYMGGKELVKEAVETLRITK